jgi:hypothetical protein
MPGYDFADTIVKAKKWIIFLAKKIYTARRFLLLENILALK